MTISGALSIETGQNPSGGTSALQGAAPKAADPGDYQRIREVLAKLNYTDQGVFGLLGIENLGRLREAKLPALLWRTKGGTPLETLVRLFVLGQPAHVPAGPAPCN